MSDDTIAWGELHTRLAAAIKRRTKARLPEPGVTDAFRMVHDRADGLPGLIIDSWAGVDLLRLRSEAWYADGRLRHLAATLAGLGRTQLRVLVDEPRKHAPRALESLERGLNSELELLGLRAESERLEVLESGLRYEVRFDEGYSQGIFLDMREVRADLRARWRDRRVANLFSYTCPFGVALGAANDVVNVDVSRRWLAWGERNYELNGLSTEGAFVEEDAFAYLDAARRRGERFDAIIVDPPVQSRGKKGKSRPFALRRDLGPLVERSMEALAPGGEIFVSTNFDALPQAAFRRLMIGIARDRGYWLEKQWGPGADFPASPRDYHLKTALLRPELPGEGTPA